MNRKFAVIFSMLLIAGVAFASPGHLPRMGWIIFSLIIFSNVLWGTIDLFFLGKSRGFIEYGIAGICFLIVAFTDDPSIFKEMFSSLFKCYV